MKVEVGFFEEGILLKKSSLSLDGAGSDDDLFKQFVEKYNHLEDEVDQLNITRKQKIAINHNRPMRIDEYIYVRGLRLEGFEERRSLFDRIEYFLKYN